MERRVAAVSGFLRTMLTTGSAFAEGSRGAIDLPDITGAVLEVCVRYMVYKVMHQGSRVPIPPFRIPPSLALDTLQAASFLDM